MRSFALPSVAALVSVAALASGCPAHVVLPPPPDASSSEELRNEYFEKNRALPVERGQRTPRTRMFESKPTFLQRSISLKNGAEVHHVEDLRPLVADDSLAAQAIDLAIAKGADARTINTIAGVTGGLGVVSGLTTLVLGITGVDLESVLPSIDLGSSDPAIPNKIPGYIVYGGGTALVTLAVGTGFAIWGSTADDDAALHRSEAFRRFDDGLRARLGLPPLAEHGEDDSSDSPTSSSPSSPSPSSLKPTSEPLAPLEGPTPDEMDVKPPE